MRGKRKKFSSPSEKDIPFTGVIWVRDQKNFSSGLGAVFEVGASSAGVASILGGNGAFGACPGTSPPGARPRWWSGPTAPV